MGQNSAVILGSLFTLGFANEVTYGTDPGTSAYSRVFVLVQNATLPDPVIDIQPIWTTGRSSNRNWYVAYKGKITLNGSIPDIWLLDGRSLVYPIGSVSSEVSGAGYTIHLITESLNLPSIAVHATYSDTSGAVQLMRRFYGGKVNRATIEANEGDFLKMSFDEVNFSNFAHSASGVPFYSASVADISSTYPTTQPYLFSYGSLTLDGTVFARIRNFRLSISNNLDPKYYITTGAAASQLPYEYREYRREYRLSCQIDISDASLYKELVQQGVYSSVYKGFQVIIQFTRGANDSILLEMPSTTPAAGGDAMGCLIMNAPHNIVTDSVVSVPLDIIGRNLAIQVTDNISTYVY